MAAAAAEFELVAELIGHEGDVRCVASLEGGRLVSGSRDRFAKVWQASADGKAFEVEATCFEHEHFVNAALALPPGSFGGLLPAGGFATGCQARVAADACCAAAPSGIQHPARPAAYCLLPAACCLLPAACCLLPAACCLLPAACCLLPATPSLLLALAAVGAADEQQSAAPAQVQPPPKTTPLRQRQRPAPGRRPPPPATRRESCCCRWRCCSSWRAGLVAYVSVESAAASAAGSSS